MGRKSGSMHSLCEDKYVLIQHIFIKATGGKKSSVTATLFDLSRKLYHKVIPSLELYEKGIETDIICFLHTYSILDLLAS